MRKVTFKIDDLAWMQKFYGFTEMDMQNIFGEADSFKAIYTLYGEDNDIDRYTLTDYDGNKIRLDDLNGFQKGVVLNDCYAYFVGGRYHCDGKEPCGVIDIKEEKV